jgi:hypothetical protein
MYGYNQKSSFNIVINQNNVVAGSNNSEYTYRFPRGSINLKNASVAIQKISMYYSWQNVTDELNNRAFKLLFPTGASFTELDVILPVGNYTIEQINAYMQSVMVQNHLYHVNAATGAFRYYIELKSNPTKYTIDLICHDLPTTLPSGWNEPNGATFPYPTQSGQQPSLITLDNNFRFLIGFSSIGAYFDHSSDITPQMSGGISSILVRNSLINNKFSNPPDICLAFTSHGSEYGSLISVEPATMVFNRIEDGFYDHITIRFVDNLFRRLNILDPNLCVLIIIQADE